MSTTPLSRRAGARVAAVAALTLAVGPLLGSPALAAPLPADNGDVKIHEVGTDFTDQRDEPKVCDFYLAAFNFDGAPTPEHVTWSIDPQSNGPGAGTGHLDGELTVAADGSAHTMPLGLPNGLYKLTWKTDLGHGKGKFKVFKVDCASPKPTPSTPGGGPGGGTGGPNGGPPAGGGGLARDAAISPVAGAAAVGLAAVTGAVWFRLRRRTHGAS
ncbi:hypothetical protein ACQEWB_09975 [Streptomyces sp. CA-249302]|uniref:hypothetical protein n=1 Tax=Streptomyces sp. CA-249302 TaxID=3240058 RepID=UPI003D940E97